MSHANVPEAGRPVNDPAARGQRAREEAAAWYAKLSSGGVSNADLNAFFDWREDSLNDAAYTRVEGLTTTARALSDDPRLQALAEQAMRRPKASQRRKLPPLVLFVGLAALATATMIAALMLVQPFGHTYSTTVGERRAIALEDGSTVELNTDSQVRVRLGKDTRRLELVKGQALFAVAHDAGRPFIVTAGDTSVRAIGTRFEVYKTGGEVRVVLAEGKVRVSKTDAKVAPVFLTAGERADVRPRAPITAAAVDVGATLGWTEGRLTFQDAPLEKAVAEVNRYSRRRITLGQGAPAQERVNGVFDVGDTDGFVAGVSTMLDLKSTRRSDGGVELTAESAG